MMVLMARRRVGRSTIVSRPRRPSRFQTLRARRPKRNDFKRHGMMALKGAGVGLALSIGLGYAGRYLNQPLLAEAGQRAGSIAASYVGGTTGQTAYQIADAAFDRFVRVGGINISGTQGFNGV